MCASHFKSVRKYALPPPLGSKHLNFKMFSSVFCIISTQTINIDKEVYTLKRFVVLRAISNLFSSFLYTLYKTAYLLVRCTTFLHIAYKILQFLQILHSFTSCPPFRYACYITTSSDHKQAHANTSRMHLCNDHYGTKIVFW